MGKILKLVLTGGPCAGKTTSIERLRDFLTSRGYVVLTIPEAATTVMSNGINFDPEIAQSFQIAITTIQRNNEDTFFNYAQKMADVKNIDVVVLMDRGLIDGAVYVPKKEFDALLNSLNLKNMKKVMKRYDSVLFLDSAAVGAEKFYFGHVGRRETTEEAVIVNKKTFEVWKDHENIAVFDNENKTFEKKMREIVTAVCNLLEIPVTMKIPKRYIINFSIDNIPKEIKLSKSHVEKTFIKSNNEILSKRDNRDEKEFLFVRKISSDKATSFVLKTVCLASDKQQIELKEHLNERQYNLYLRFADPTRRKVTQTRFYFTLKNVKYEICRYEKDGEDSENFPTLLNVFPPISKWKSGKSALPAFLDVGEEVTRDFKYSSHYLSLLDKSKPYTLPEIHNVNEIKCRIVQGEPDFE